MPDSLAEKVRAKFPGAYDDLSDTALEAKVLAAHPEYRDLATPPTPTTPWKDVPGAMWQGLKAGVSSGFAAGPGAQGTGPTNPELHREDVSVGGLPPELAAVSGLGVARAVAAPAATIAGRAVAGLKAVAAQAGPVVKYEATKSGLQALGVPSTVAVPLAMLVSGYKRGGAAPATAEAPAALGTTVAPESNASYEAATGHARGQFPTPAAAEPVPVPLSQAVTAVQHTAAASKIKLTAEEFSTATTLAAQGHSPDDVIKGVTALRDLKASSSMAAMPTTAEMRADMGRRAVGGQKSLMAEYGPPVEQTPTPPTPTKSPQQLLNEEAIAARRARHAAKQPVRYDDQGNAIE